MMSQEGCITVTWEIRNFSILLRAKELYVLPSPTWEVEDTEGTLSGWLVVEHYDSKLKFYVCGLNVHPVRFEVSFVSSCGDVLLNAEDSSRTSFELPKSALFDESSQSILLNDTFTLCCKIWGKAIKTSECHIATVLHSLNHLWTIGQLASSDYHATYFEQENVKLCVSLKKNGFYGNWMVIAELEPHAPDNLSAVDCILSVKDNFERVLNYQRPAFSSKNRYKYFIKTSSNITGVTLQLELFVALHEKHELPASSQVVRKTQLKPNSSTNSSKHKNVSGALGDDFLLLYRNSAFSDATLNTEGKSFSAHRNVLAARSPVFCAMFEKDETSEGQSGVVDIDDVDSETMDRLLVYLYADSVGDLAFEEASALYYAADKYEILPLKEKCADFLKACLAADNACDALVLADRHSDQALMNCVVNFILGHEEVVSSAQWEELEKDNPMLCAKVVKQLFFKKGKK